MLYETRFLLALVTTCVVEIPVLVALIRLVFHNREQSLSWIIFTGVLCTALTLPYLWFVLPPYIDAAFYPLTGEGLVIIVETIVINRILGLNLKQSAVCSVMMNLASFGLGLVLL
jgi:hypothetical protein